jgi:hypothetical protein
MPYESSAGLSQSGRSCGSAIHSVTDNSALTIDLGGTNRRADSAPVREGLAGRAQSPVPGGGATAHAGVAAHDLDAGPVAVDPEMRFRHGL